MDGVGSMVGRISGKDKLRVKRVGVMYSGTVDQVKKCTISTLKNSYFLERRHSPLQDSPLCS